MSIMVAEPKLTKLIISSVCLLLFISFGLRSAFGLFILPMAASDVLTVSDIAFALALQNLAWGAAAPFVGYCADRFGAVYVLLFGAVMYSSALFLAIDLQQPILLSLVLGLMLGIGIAATSFGIALPILAKLAHEQERQKVLALATAIGAAGQFFLVPIIQQLFSWYHWQEIFYLMAATAALMLLCLLPLRAGTQVVINQPESDELTVPAITNSNFYFLALGFLVCGFQIAFIGMHLPAYLGQLNFSGTVAATALAIIGLVNIFGTYIFGAAATKYSPKQLLMLIYGARAITWALFILVPISHFTILGFSVLTGFFWLGTVPLTMGLLQLLADRRHLSALFGLVFFGHQIGSFLGVYLGGLALDYLGSYQIIWMAAVLLSIIALWLHQQIRID